MKISEQTILITGAAGSIGSFLANKLCVQANQVIALDNNQSLLEKQFEANNKIKYFVCDLTDYNATCDIISEIVRTNTITVLINMAGVIHNELLINMLNQNDKKHTFESFDRTVKASLYTTFNATVAVAESMVSGKTNGLIIGVSSIAKNGNAGQTAYSAAKSGIEAMIKTWSRELGMFGIRSVGIAPGFFDTVSTGNALTDNAIKRYQKKVPLSRFGNLEELYSAIVFLIENDYYNGQILEIDGGMNI